MHSLVLLTTLLAIPSLSQPAVIVFCPITCPTQLPPQPPQTCPRSANYNSYYALPASPSASFAPAFATNTPGSFYAPSQVCQLAIDNPSYSPLDLTFVAFETEGYFDELTMDLDYSGDPQRVRPPSTPVTPMAPMVLRVLARNIVFTFVTDSSVQHHGIQFTITRATGSLSPSPFPRASAPPHAHDDDFYGPGAPGRALPPCLSDGACEFQPTPAVYASGVAGSVVVSLLLCAGAVATALSVRPAPPASPLAKAWQARAARAFPIMLSAHCLLLTGVITGVASLAIVFASLSGMEGGAVLGAFLLAPAVFSFIGLLCLVLPGAILSGLAAVQLRKLAVGGAMPSAPAGCSCCAPTAPAIQGLAWSGTLFFFILGLSTRLLMVRGLALDVFAVVCLLVGCVLASAAGCCVMGPLPALGSGRENVCCVEPSGGGGGEGAGGALTAAGNLQGAIEVGALGGWGAQFVASGAPPPGAAAGQPQAFSALYTGAGGAAAAGAAPQLQMRAPHAEGSLPPGFFVADPQQLPPGLFVAHGAPPPGFFAAAPPQGPWVAAAEPPPPPPQKQPAAPLQQVPPPPPPPPPHDTATASGDSAP